MTRHALILAAAMLAAACAAIPREKIALYRPALEGWRPMTDGASFAGWTRLGEANWRWEDGALVADRGEGYLVSRRTYRDFEMEGEFHAEADTNSGILVRCQDPRDITPLRCYEVNIWDARPGQEYATGAIVEVAKVASPVRAAGRWNTFRVSARGDRLEVAIDGVVTARVRDPRLAEGLIALQHAKGTRDDRSAVRFRNLRIRPITCRLCG